LGIGNPARAVSTIPGTRSATRNQIGGCGARFDADVHQPSPFVGFLPLQFGDLDSARAGETLGGLGRPAIGTESGAQGRTAPLLPAVGLSRR